MGNKLNWRLVRYELVWPNYMPGPIYRPIAGNALQFRTKALAYKGSAKLTSLLGPPSFTQFGMPNIIFVVYPRWIKVAEYLRPWPLLEGEDL